MIVMIYCCHVYFYSGFVCFCCCCIAENIHAASRVDDARGTSGLHRVTDQNITRDLLAASQSSEGCADINVASHMCTVQRIDYLWFDYVLKHVQWETYVFTLPLSSG